MTFHNFLPGMLHVTQVHKIIGMSHRAACGWSHVDSGPVRPCTFCSDPLRQVVHTPLPNSRDTPRGGL